ncbi:MAG: hypothetical protein V7708_08080 [Oceanicoccus sp.]
MRASLMVQREGLRVVSEQYGAPTYGSSIAGDTAAEIKIIMVVG